MSKQAKQSSKQPGRRELPKKRPSLYQVLKEDLVQSIRSGKLKPGDRVPSESQLIAKYHVSSTTARRCLDELEGEGLLERQRGRGTFVSGLATVLKRERVALVVNSLFSFTHPFLATVAATLEKRLDEAGVHIVVIRVRNAAGSIKDRVADMLEHEGCRHALILSSLPLATVQSMVERGIHCIGINVRYLDTRIPNISIDFMESFRLRLRELGRLGHRQIVALMHDRPLKDEGVLNSPSMIDEAYMQIRKEFPELPETLLVRLVDNAAELSMHVTDLMQEEKNRPTAFLCWDEICAIEVRQCLEDIGYQVPQQVSLIGSKLLPSSSVACVEIPIEEMADLAAQSLLDWMKTGQVPESVQLPPKALLPRETLGRVPSPAG